MVFMKLLETLSQRYLDSFHFQVSKDLLTSQLTRHLVGKKPFLAGMLFLFYHQTNNERLTF